MSLWGKRKITCSCGKAEIPSPTSPSFNPFTPFPPILTPLLLPVIDPPLSPPSPSSASKHGHLSVVEYCLDQGAVAVANPITNKTALHMACKCGHTDVVVSLLNRLPALLMIDDSPGETSLHIASRAGHTEIVRNLLMVAEQTEVLKSSECSDKEEEEMKGFLYDHNKKKHVMNEALPEIEVDVMARSGFENRTPLHDAAINDNTEVVKLIVDFLKTHTDSPRLSRSIAGRSSFLHSPSLHKGSVRGKGPSSQASNLDDPFYRSNSTVKHLEAAPGIDLSTLKGRTAFHEASRNEHHEVMEILLKGGADINAFMNMDLDPTVNTDLTALVQACLMDKPDTVRFLLQHGAKDARLKALSRSLKGSLFNVAGILLCYNNYVKEVAHDVAKELSLSSETSKKFYQVMWNSKNLKFIRKEWLETVVSEMPRLHDHSCAIAQLDISSNLLTELPIEIFKLPYLTNLDIGRNQIKELPCEEGKSNGGWKCSRLSVLEAVKNQITSLPPCLFSLGELKEINVCSNKISSVPASVWCAPKLCKLYLATNLLESFPTTSTRASDSPVWNISSDSPSHLSSFSPTSPANSAVSDSGYRSDSHSNMPLQVDSEVVGGSFPQINGRGGGRERRPSVFQLPYTALSNLRTLDSKAQTIQTQAVISRRLESFHDATMEVEEFLEELEEVELEEEQGEGFMLEVLDLSSNKLTSVPTDLCCLTPKLTKLNLAKNHIKSLVSINDYPLDLEFFDASHNDLNAAICPAASLADLRYHQACGRKQFLLSPCHSGTASGGGGGGGAGLAESFGTGATAAVNMPTTPPSYLSKLCSHRTHKNLRKLSTLKMSHNHLIDVQLFRSVNKNTRSRDLSASMEEPFKPRSNTTDPYALSPQMPQQPSPMQQPRAEALSKSFNFISRAAALTSSSKKNLADLPIAQSDVSKASTGVGGGTGGSPSEGGSQEGSDSKGEAGQGSSSASIVISPLYPILATLELSNNCLKNVPSNVHRISTLSSLMLSHNQDIDTLPLEISNLEHLWNLEYEGCPLTNPPKEDLDKYRLASDKLLYMRSLLHE